MGPVARRFTKTFGKVACVLSREDAAREFCSMISRNICSLSHRFTQFTRPATAERDDEAIISGVVTSPRVMRQMPHLLQAAGLQLIASFPYVIAEVGKADFWAPAIESFRRLVPKSGAMTEQEANAWADNLLGDSAAGVFFGASNYYGYVARRSRA